MQKFGKSGNVRDRVSCSKSIILNERGNCEVLREVNDPSSCNVGTIGKGLWSQDMHLSEDMVKRSP